MDLPHLIRDWLIIPVNNTLLPSWNASLFLSPSSSTPPMALHLSVSHAVASNLRASCLPSLLKALHKDHVEHSTWLNSYNEEKKGLKDNGTYVEISLQKYRCL